MRSFRQVDVFSAEPPRGNPVAVVHDADDLTTEQMQRFSRWTNLSETTFLLPPTDPTADYRLRIFTPAEELPFAGHPTLGSAHAWLEAGGEPRTPGELVQECGAGPVRLRVGDRLAFAAPPLVRAGPATAEERASVLAALRVADEDVIGLAWIDNGPGWIGAVLRDADAVLAVDPDWAAFDGLEVGIVGRYAHPAPGEPLVEVRAFCPGLGVVEDPVTGSLNASLAQWLTGPGAPDEIALPASYVASQGTRLGRAGRVHVDRRGDTVWVGGDTVTVVTGQVQL
jgi:PhzF family phenazine biosynthesis protein